MAIASHKLRLSTAHPEHGAEVLHFAPKDLCAPGQALALNTGLGTLSYLSWQDDHPVQIMEQRFTTSEICVLVPLLQAYPYYCPYEALLSSFETGRIISEKLMGYRTRLQEAQQTGQWEEMVRPVRAVLSRTRLKIRSFDLEISAINETGYVLRGATHVPVIPTDEQALVSLRALR